MRNVFPLQMSIGQIGIADIQIDVTSRDDIPVILLGLQHIYTTLPLRDAVFKILEEVAPTKLDNDEEKVVSINKGRPGMDQWSILVLGALRLGLNADYDRILELANQHRTLREMLGLGCFDADKRYCLQTLKDNLKLFTPKVMARINVEVIQAGYRLLDLDVHAMNRGRCDSFVLKTDVHFPTDINLLFDAIRTLIHVCAKWHAQHVLPGWRNHQSNLRQFKRLYRKLQKLKHSTSKNEAKKAAKELEINLDQVVLPKKGKLSKADQEREYAPEFMQAKRQHSAVESAINALEVHGLDKCPDHGIDAFERYVALAVLSRNIQKLGTIKREEERQRLLIEKQKQAA